MTDSACPSIDQLSQFMDGSLDDSSAEAISEHLGRCDRCIRRMDDLVAIGTGGLPAALRGTREQSVEAVFAQEVAPHLVESPEEPETLVPGTQVDEYEILGLIAVGGMGRVYRAKHRKLQRPVAIKVLPTRRTHDPHFLARFDREMRAVGGLEHPNIVRATDAGESDGRPFLVMELIDGIDGGRYVRESLRLDPVEAADWIRQAAEGLAHAHRHGLIHRDVKPGNLMRCGEGNVKLLDLGLASIHGMPPETRPAAHDAATHAGDQSLTDAHVVLGTPAYMAPEQRAGRKLTDRCDTYGLGRTYFEFLAGTLPEHISGLRHPSIEQYRKDIPESAVRLLHAMLSDRSEDRPSCAQVAADLYRLSLPPRKPRQKFAAYAAVAVLLMAGAVSATVAFLGNRGRTTTTETVAQTGGTDTTDPQPRVGTEPKPPAKEVPVPDPPAGKLPMTPDFAVDLQRQWAERLKSPVFPINKIGMKFAVIPPGRVALGPKTFVTISDPYELGVCEVTLGHFLQFIQETGYKATYRKGGARQGAYVFVEKNPASDTNPSLQKWRVSINRSMDYCIESPGFNTSPNHPVTHVTWLDASEFCDWLTKKDGRIHRLPSEAEWKWACRAGSMSTTYAGEISAIRNFENLLPIDPLKVLAVPRPVASYRSNTWGLHDMLGNVCEYMLDYWQRQLPEGDSVDYRGPIFNTSVVACGAGYSSYVGEANCDRRSGVSLNAGSSVYGFRVLREIAPRKK